MQQAQDAPALSIRDFDATEAFDLVTAKLSEWLADFIAMLPNLAVAVLIVCVFWLLAKVARRIVRGALVHVTHNKNVVGLLAQIVGIGVLAGGIFIALGILNLDQTVTTLLAGAGVIGLALGFAFQDIAANFISGVIMAIRQPFREGDIIETNGHMGVVEKIDLRATKLRRFQGQIVILPNKEVFQNPIINYNTNPLRRVDVACGVSYGDDLSKAMRLAVMACKDVKHRNESKPVELFYEEFADSSINFQLRFWIPFGAQADYLAAKSEAIQRIKHAFDQEGITIPFPIRTLDFSVVGGKELAEAWPGAGQGGTA